MAIQKGIDEAKKAVFAVPLAGRSLTHEILGVHDAARVLLKPAAPGTGVIAGGGVRAVVEACGVSDILSKSLGSDNILNVVQATFTALQSVKDFRLEAANRGVDPKHLAPFWYREEANG